MGSFEFSGGYFSMYSDNALLPAKPEAIGFVLPTKNNAILGSIPSVVIGSSMIYIMCSQITGGLQIDVVILRILKA
jgi:hypothetical protein